MNPVQQNNPPRFSPMLKRQLKTKNRELLQCGEANSEAEFMDSAKDWHKTKLEKRHKKLQHTMASKSVIKTFKGGHKPKRKNPKHGFSELERELPRESVLKNARRAQQATRERASLMKKLDAIVGPTVKEQALVCSNTDLLNPGPPKRKNQPLNKKEACREPVRIEVIRPIPNIRADYVKKKDRKKKGHLSHTQRRLADQAELAEALDQCFQKSDSESDYDAYLYPTPVASTSAVKHAPVAMVDDIVHPIIEPLPVMIEQFVSAHVDRCPELVNNEMYIRPIPGVNPYMMPLDEFELFSEPIFLGATFYWLLWWVTIYPLVVMWSLVPLNLLFSGLMLTCRIIWAPIYLGFQGIYWTGYVLSWPFIHAVILNYKIALLFYNRVVAWYDYIVYRVHRAWRRFLRILDLVMLGLAVSIELCCVIAFPDLCGMGFLGLFVTGTVIEFFIYRYFFKEDDEDDDCEDDEEEDPDLEMPEDVAVLEGRVLTSSEVRRFIEPLATSYYRHCVTVIPVGCDDRIITDLGIPPVSRPYELGKVYLSKDVFTSKRHALYYVPSRILLWLVFFGLLFVATTVVMSAYGPPPVTYVESCDMCEYKKCVPTQVCWDPSAKEMEATKHSLALFGSKLTGYCAGYYKENWHDYCTVSEEPCHCRFVAVEDWDNKVTMGAASVWLWVIVAWLILIRFHGWTYEKFIKYVPVFIKNNLLDPATCRVLYYVPHLVSTVLRDYPLNALPGTLGRSVRQRLLCCPSFPLSARDSAQLLDGTETVINFLLNNRNFIQTAGLGPWDQIHSAGTIFERGATGHARLTCPSSVVQNLRQESMLRQPHIYEKGPRTSGAYLTARYRALDLCQLTEMTRSLRPRVAISES